MPNLVSVQFEYKFTGYVRETPKVGNRRGASYVCPRITYGAPRTTVG